MWGPYITFVYFSFRSIIVSFSSRCEAFDAWHSVRRCKPSFLDACNITLPMCSKLIRVSNRRLNTCTMFQLLGAARGCCIESITRLCFVPLICLQLLILFFSCHCKHHVLILSRSIRRARLSYLWTILRYITQVWIHLNKCLGIVQLYP